MLSLATCIALPSLARAADFHVADGDVPGLIAAIDAANANPGADTIYLAPDGVYTLTAVHNTGTFGSNGLPPITQGLTIVGNGATIERHGSRSTPGFRVIEVRNGHLTTDRLSIRNGRCQFGAGIFVDYASLTFANGTIQNNDATGGFGGGICASGWIIVTGSTIYDNHASVGGGVFAKDISSLTMTNCTISGNTAWIGSAIDSSAETLISQCTISENASLSTGEGAVVIHTLYDDAVLVNNIIANNENGDCHDATGALYDAGYNLIGDGSCITHPTSFSGDPLLGPLADNGGPTLTHALLEGSPAIDGGTCQSFAVPVDQRGVVRPQGANCDIGAVEYLFGGCEIPNPIAAGDTQALISAIACANLTPEPSHINLAPNATYTVTEVVDSIDGPNGLPSITGGVLINGNGATIERAGGGGTPAFRLLHVGATGDLRINRLTIRNGVCTEGAAILNAGGRITIDATTVRECAAGADGGAILNTGTLTLTNSTITDNRAQVNGGGILNVGVASLTNSTVSGNAADSRGGGVFTPESGETTITLCTISDNVALIDGGNVFADGGRVTLSNSVIANSIGGDCVSDGAVVNDAGFNVIEDGGCISAPTSVSGDPLLGPLADNGGPTMTHALLFGSNAFDAGDCAGNSIFVDQRGIARPLGAACDIGALESEDVCVPDLCPSGSTPLSDSGGRFSGWCVLSDAPENVAIVTHAVGTHVVEITVDKDFDEPPAPDGTIHPIVLHFVQVCRDEYVRSQINISCESIANSTTADWHGYAWSLDESDPAWIDSAYSRRFSTEPFALASFSDFVGPPADRRTRVLTATYGIVADGDAFLPGGTDAQLSIRVNLDDDDTPVTFTLLEEPLLQQPCAIPPIIADGDVAALIAAIHCANSTPESDVINLASEGHFTLTSIENDTDGLNGLPMIAGELTINGNNATIECPDDPNTPGFRIMPVHLTGDVAIHALTVRHSGSDAISNRGTAWLSGCNIRENVDGVVNETGARLVLEDCVVAQNTRYGIRTAGDGTTDMIRTTICDNSGVSAILCRDSLTMTACSVLRNTSLYEAGGLDLEKDTAIVIDTLFAENSGREGGAIRAKSSITIEGCILRDNWSALSGGALYVDNQRFGTTVIAGTLLAANGSGKFGGGIYLRTTDARLSRCIITDNAAEDGGGIYSVTPLIMDACTIDHNAAALDDGGGLYLRGTSTLNECAILGNTAYSTGGGIENAAGVLTIHNSTIAGNSCLRGGGGISNESYGTLVLDACTLSDNHVTLSGFGGAISNSGPNRTATVRNCTISGNSAALGDGGGIHNLSTEAFIANCTISGNSVLTPYLGGAGIASDGTEILHLSNTITANNVGGDCRGSRLQDDGHNLIGDGSCISHPTSFSGNPRLGPLADNGGPTLTHALRPGSPAVDAGDCAGGTVTVDQRGMPRPGGAACDIGAFEGVVPVRPAYEQGPPLSE